MISGTSERAWKHWEAGARPVPPDVAQRVRELADWRSRAIDAGLAELGKMKKRHGEPADIALVWYQNQSDWPNDPAMWRPHQSVCAALVAKVGARLVVFDSLYWLWLEGRPDAESMRGAWAAATLAKRE